VIGDEDPEEVLRLLVDGVRYGSETARFDVVHVNSMSPRFRTLTGVSGYSAYSSRTVLLADVVERAVQLEELADDVTVCDPVPTR